MVASSGARRTLLLLAGVGAALLLRLGLAGSDGSGSLLAGGAFAASLLALSTAAGWRPRGVSGLPRVGGAGVGLAEASERCRAWRPGLTAVLGLVGGAVLLAAPLLRGSPTVLRVPGAWVLGTWAPVVALVAIAEEVALRGVLYASVRGRWGDAAAVVVAALAFGLLHVPLYGWGALPLDLVAGLWLGVLRAVSGGVTAPALAHALADLGTAWVV